MTKRKLILGFVCCCCLLETGNAALNNRTQKLLETQSVNAQPAGGAQTNSNAPANVNARPSYGPTHGVFDSPVKSGGNVLPRK